MTHVKMVTTSVVSHRSTKAADHTSEPLCDLGHSHNLTVNDGQSLVENRPGTCLNSYWQNWSSSNNGTTNTTTGNVDFSTGKFLAFMSHIGYNGFQVSNMKVWMDGVKVIDSNMPYHSAWQGWLFPQGYQPPTTSGLVNGNPIYLERLTQLSTNTSHITKNSLQ